MRLDRIKKDNRDIKIETYDNLREFVRVSDERPENSWSEHTNVSASDREFLLHGWDEMKKRIDNNLSKLDKVNTKPQKLKQKIYTINGYYPNVSRALRGNPRCMGKYQNKMRASKIVEIIWDPGAAWVEHADTIAVQGVRLLGKIKSLELAGYRVRLLVQGFKGREETEKCYVCRITIKEENQPLDLSRIAYPLANVKMLRTWMFHWYEHLPDAEYISGYGVSLYKWNSYKREQFLKLLNISPNQYYVNLGTNIDEMFNTLLEGGK